VTIISELGTTLAITSNGKTQILVTLIMEAIRSSETSVLTRATWRNLPEDGNLHSHRHEDLRSYLSVLLTKELFLEINVFHVRFEAFRAVTMKIGVFRDVMPCGSCKNRRFEGT
jgi:lantibiotic modifying enzyme